MAWKDSYSATLSSVALIISGISAYYSLFRVSVDATLLVAGDHYPAYGEKAGGIDNVYWDVSLTFINNGNRPYAVQNIELDSFSVRALDSKLSDCKSLSGGGDVTLAGIITEPDPKSFAPSVIDPGKIVILHPSYVNDPAKDKQALAFRVSTGRETSRPSSSKPSLPDAVSLIGTDLPDGVVNLVSCLRVHLVDHQGYLHTISKPVAFTQRVTSGADEGEGIANRSAFFEKPINLSGLLAEGDLQAAPAAAPDSAAKKPSS